MLELIFQELSINYDSKAGSLKALFQDMERLLAERNLVLYGIKIDDKEIFDDYIQYLEEEVGRYSTIKPMVATRKEIRDNLLLSTEQYLMRANPALKQMSSQFYREPSEDTWTLFQQWSEGFEWIQRMLENITISCHLPIGWDQCKQTFFETHPFLVDLEQAMEHGDWTLVGDILTHEILPRYESLHFQISMIIDQEVVRDDLN